MNQIARGIRIALPALLLATSIPAATELELLDGQVLIGRSVERDDDLYLLSLESGQVLPLPAALVREVREVEVAEDAPTATPDYEEIGESESFAAEARKPLVDRDFTPERPRMTVELPDDGAGTSRFSNGVVDPDWMPATYTPEKPMLDELDPSGWYRSPTYPHFDLKSGFDLPEGESMFRPDRWNSPLVRSNWKPRNGFRDE